ncbi:unnamed protein product [Candida parapsilosis]
MLVDNVVQQQQALSQQPKCNTATNQVSQSQPEDQHQLQKSLQSNSNNIKHSQQQQQQQQLSQGLDFHSKSDNLIFSNQQHTTEQQQQQQQQQHNSNNNSSKNLSTTTTCPTISTPTAFHFYSRRAEETMNLAATAFNKVTKTPANKIKAIHDPDRDILGCYCSGACFQDKFASSYNSALNPFYTPHKDELIG